MLPAPHIVLVYGIGWVMATLVPAIGVAVAIKMSVKPSPVISWLVIS
jgi:hypothetical protein